LVVRGRRAATAALRGAVAAHGADRALLRRLYLARAQQMVQALGLHPLRRTERLALVGDLSALAAGRSVPDVEGGDGAARRARDGLRALMLFGRCDDDVLDALPWTVVAATASTRALDRDDADPQMRHADPARLPSFLARQQARVLADSPAAWVAFATLSATWTGTVADLLTRGRGCRSVRRVDRRPRDAHAGQAPPDRPAAAPWWVRPLGSSALAGSVTGVARVAARGCGHAGAVPGQPARERDRLEAEVDPGGVGQLVDALIDAAQKGQQPLVQHAAVTAGVDQVGELLLNNGL
jgi:hypothetical protein